MKTHLSFILGFLLALSSSVFAATAETSSPAQIDSADSFNLLTGTLKSTTFQDRDRLSESLLAFEQQLAVTLANRTAQGATTSAEIDEKISRARVDLTEKFKVLSSSSVETWNSAKDNALAAIQTLRLALRGETQTTY